MSSRDGFGAGIDVGVDEAAVSMGHLIDQLVGADLLGELGS
jgi:hypothetical protein